MNNHKLKDVETIKMFWELPNDAYITVETLSLVRCISISTLYHERADKIGIPYRKVGNRILYKKADIINWIEKDVNKDE